MGSIQLLHRLPEELRQDVIDRLNRDDLVSLNLASRWCYQIATPLIWKEINLVDCRTTRQDGALDDHDDLPILGKLLTIVNKPWLGSCVQTVTHRCHLPPPAIFHELPRTPFSGQTLSSDPRTTKVVQSAARHMTKVHTLRIIFGHPNINDALLRCFFDKDRRCDTRIRRLWLENCRISAGCAPSIPRHPLELPLMLDFNGLESIRFRRLPIRPGLPVTHSVPMYQFVNSRGGKLIDLQDGAGGQMSTATQDARSELSFGTMNHSYMSETAKEMDISTRLDNIFQFAHKWDDSTYEELSEHMTVPLEIAAWNVVSHKERSLIANRGPLLDPWPEDFPEHDRLMRAQRERLPSADVMCHLLKGSSGTLTSICLDWVLTMPYHLPTSPYPEVYEPWMSMFTDFFALRFPHLRAFQLRNAVVVDTLLPPGLYLLDRASIRPRNDVRVHSDFQFNTLPGLDLACLEFMEAHANLQCLGWPVDAFFSGKSVNPDIAGRVQNVVDNLGRTLVDLRVDTLYSGVGEFVSEENDSRDRFARDRRRRFTSDFASHMTKIKSIKVEGGMPREERREIIRALHRCPLEKIVCIGVCNPLGNTWGAEGRELNEIFQQDDLECLEAEHKDAIYSLGFKQPEPPLDDFKFIPTYGWPPSPPMIHTIASFHASTVRELKFCGYKGAPILFQPTPITQPMLAALKHFSKLESLIMSVWLSTFFEEGHRDSEIIKYWVEARSPASTSLVHITDEEPEGWAKELRTKFAPPALAWEITNRLGPFLSEVAKRRRGGVHVRASVCIGDWGGIFDIDIHIGKGAMNSDICLGYHGPREEFEPEKRKSKLESRRWF